MRRKKVVLILVLVISALFSSSLPVNAATTHYWAKYEVVYKDFWEIDFDNPIEDEKTWDSRDDKDERYASCYTTVEIDQTNGHYNINDKKSFYYKDKHVEGTVGYYNRTFPYIRRYYYKDTGDDEYYFLYRQLLQVVKVRKPVYTKLISVVTSSSTTEYPDEEKIGSYYYEYLGKTGDYMRMYKAYDEDGVFQTLVVNPRRDIRFEYRDGYTTRLKNSLVLPPYIEYNDDKTKFRVLDPISIQGQIITSKQYMIEYLNRYDDVISTATNWSGASNEYIDIPMEYLNVQITTRAYASDQVSDPYIETYERVYWAKYSGDTKQQYRFELLTRDDEQSSGTGGAAFDFNPDTGEVDILGIHSFPSWYDDDDRDYNSRIYNVSDDGKYFYVWYDDRHEDSSHIYKHKTTYEIVQKTVSDKSQFECLIMAGEDAFKDGAINADGYWYEKLGEYYEINARYETYKVDKYGLYRVWEDEDVAPTKGYTDYDFDSTTGEISLSGSYGYADYDANSKEREFRDGVYYWNGNYFVYEEEKSSKDNYTTYYKIDKGNVMKQGILHDYIPMNNSGYDMIFQEEQENYMFEEVEGFMPTPPIPVLNAAQTVFTLHRGGTIAPTTGVAQYKMLRGGDVYQDWSNYIEGQEIEIPYKLNMDTVICTRTMQSNGILGMEYRTTLSLNIWGKYTYHTETIYELEEVPDSEEKMSGYQRYNLYTNCRVDRETGRIQLSGAISDIYYKWDEDQYARTKFYTMEDSTTLYQYDYYEPTWSTAEYLHRTAYKVVPETIIVRDTLQEVLISPSSSVYPQNTTSGGYYYQYLGNRMYLYERYLNEPYNEYFMKNFWYYRNEPEPREGYSEPTLNNKTGEFIKGTTELEDLPFYVYYGDYFVDDGYEYWYWDDDDKAKLYVKCYQEFDRKGAYKDIVLEGNMNLYSSDSGYNRDDNFWYKGINMPEPTVTLNYPANNFTAIDRNQTFKWTVNHPLSIFKVTSKVYVDGVLKYIVPSTIVRDQEIELYIGNLNDGWHTWYITVEMGM